MSQLIYDASIDYLAQVLEFAKKHKVWDGSTDYYNETAATAKHLSTEPLMRNKIPDWNIFWFRWYCGVTFAERKIKTQANQLARSLEVVPDLGQWIFLTVGFDDKTTIDGHIMLSLANKICRVNLKKGVPLFTSGIFNLEKHRKDKSGQGYIHHHAHFLLNLTEHTRASKIVELIFKVSGLKEFCKVQNFIDVKTPNAKDYAKRAQPYPVCDNYIHGIKSGEKHDCVGDDILWRQSLGLETIYEYSR